METQDITQQAAGNHPQAAAKKSKTLFFRQITVLCKPKPYQLMDKVLKISGVRPNKKEQKKNKRSDFNDNAVAVLCKPRSNGDQAPRDGKIAMCNVSKIHLGDTCYRV